MPAAPTFPDVLIFAIPFFIVTVALEWWFVSRRKLAGRYETKDALTSMFMGLGNSVSDIAMGFISLGVLMWFWQFRLLDWGVSLPIILAALVAQDFLYYWKHRAAHRIRWFWTAHVVHHSSEHYNLSTALRQPWNNHFTGFVLLSAPLVLLGVHPLLLAFVGAMNLLYQYWIHTEAIDKFPHWFEVVFNTPSHHRAHHGTNPEYLDCNYAGILIIWDRMFGTFVPEGDREVIRYGLVQNVGTFNPIKIAFAEMLGAVRDIFAPGLSLRQRLSYAVRPPGWSHDGSRVSSEMLKAAHVQANPHLAGTPGLPSLDRETTNAA
jgi:sterol desaturase/sphingolipid hydroxylase (fatty acid hydroxylase superfamily)